MSDYSNSFNGSGKDAGNDIIYGSDIDTQLDNVASASTTKANKIVPATTSNVGTLSSTGDLQDGGYSFSNMSGDCTATHTELNIMDGVNASTAEINGLVGITVANIPSGTKMLFQQTAAPTGWTKDTTHNDKALRVVSGTASFGGADAFSAISTHATAAHTLLESEMPSHTHTSVSGYAHLARGNGTLTPGNPDATPTELNSQSGEAMQSAGGGGSHSHDFDLDLQYVDIIIATKD